MTFSLQPEHLKRYKNVARLLFKYGRSSLVTGAGLEDVLPETERNGAGSDPKPEELADDLEKMGPVFIKLGQVLSSRADLLPQPYVEALTRLQDKLEPIPFEQVKETVEQELGVRLSKAFLEFEPTPIASASLGQVHRAALRDGRPVAVKVQRPGMQKQIAEDMAALEEMAQFADGHTEAGRRYGFTDILDEFRKNLARELDYRLEAHNLVEMRENLKAFRRIVVPAPIEDYTTSRVLTMEFVQGKKITSLSPLARQEIDGFELAEELFHAYLTQILVDGMFHADPHPGNVFITDDGRIALIDLGMIGRIAPGMQEQLLKLLIAVSEGRSEQAADVAIKIGEIQEDFDEAHFRRRIAELVLQNQNTTIADIQIGRAMLQFSQISGESNIRMPSELTMLSKTLLNLDELGRILDPAFDPNASIRRNTAQIAQKRMMKTFSVGNVVEAAMEAREFTAEFPGRVNRILDALAKNQLKLKVEAFDEATLIEGFQKVANRITTGLVLAALIIGAAMLMRVDTTFRIFGYPGLAMLCFLGAGGGGFWLVVTILLTDRPPRRKKP